MRINYTKGTLRKPTNLGPLYPERDEPKASEVVVGILVMATLLIGTLIYWW